MRFPALPKLAYQQKMGTTLRLQGLWQPEDGADGPWQLVGSELCVTHLCSLAIFLPHQHRQTPTSDGRNPTWAQCAFADVSGYEAGTQGWNELGYVLQDVSTEPVSD